MKKLLVMILVCGIFITGCTNKKYDEMMTNVKTSITNEEYDKAEEFLSLAVEEKSNDKEANALLSQIKKLNEALKLKEQGKYSEVGTLCDEIDKIESDSDIIKNSSKKLKEEVKKIVDEKNKFLSMIDEKFQDTKDLISKGNYKEAKDNLNYIIEEISDDEELKWLLDESNELLNTCNENIKKQEAQKAQEAKEKESSTQKENSTQNQIQKALKAVYNAVGSNGATYSYTNANGSYISGESESFKSKYYVFNEQYGEGASDCNYLVDKQTFKVYVYNSGGGLQEVN